MIITAMSVSQQSAFLNPGPTAKSDGVSMHRAKSAGVSVQSAVLQSFLHGHRGHDGRHESILQGVDQEYDDAEGRVKDREADLAEYLGQIRKQLGGGKELCYVTVNKDVNLLEVPQVLSCLW